MKKTGNIRKETVMEVIFFLFLFMLYAMWARVMYLNGGPDEEMRYAVAKYIYQHGSLPLGDDSEVINSVWGISYAYYPVLSYIFSAFFMKLMSFFSTAPFPLLFAARFPNVLLGVGMARIVLGIGRRLFDSAEKIWLFTIVVSLLPGSMFVFTYVNNDGLGIFSSAVIILAWVLAAEEGWTYRNCVILAAGVALCALSYYNAYGFILCSIIFFGITLWMEAKEKESCGYFIRRGILVCALVLGLSGWWFVRNAFLYDGDFLGRNAVTLCAEKYAKKGYKPSDRVTPRTEGYSLWEMLSEGFPDKDVGNSWAQNVTESFVGRFGQMNVFMPRWMINFYLNFLKLGVLMVLLHPVKIFAGKVKSSSVMNGISGMKKCLTRKGIFNLCMLAAAVIPNVLSIYYSYYSDYQPQGRYSLPMIIPLAYFVILGYDYLTEKLEDTVIRRKRVFQVLGGAMIIVAVLVFLTVIWPEYRNVPFTVSNFIFGQ